MKAPLRSSKFIPLLVGSLLCLMAFFHSSCKDFLEPKLSDKYVMLTAPADDDTIAALEPTFSWEKLDGARTYNIQIIQYKGKGGKALGVCVDSTVTTNSFTTKLGPGFYEWKVNGSNNASHTSYSLFRLTIDSTNDLSQQFVYLVKPQDQSYSRSLKQVLEWKAVPLASHYSVEIYNASNVLVDSKSAVTALTYTCNLPTEGTYKWKVIGLNSTSSSKHPVPYTFTIDTTAPAPSIPAYPISGGTADSLAWIRDTDVVLDSLFISSDSATFTTTSILKTEVATTYYRYKAGTTGQKYFFRLRSKDKVGNWSAAYSEIRRFIKK